LFRRFSLFLLFLQENISYRHRHGRRNPGFLASRQSEEQRLTSRRVGVNFPRKTPKNANDADARLRSQPLFTPIPIATLP
jgi:hypothetical protein